jgi:hypothetical protein
MSGVITAAVIVASSTLYTQNRAASAQKKAQKQAKKDAQEAELQARKAETFAETEGSGIGQLGNISLEVDEDEELETTGNISI